MELNSAPRTAPLQSTATLGMLSAAGGRERRKVGYAVPETISMGDVKRAMKDQLDWSFFCSFVSLHFPDGKRSFKKNLSGQIQSLRCSFKLHIFEPTPSFCLQTKDKSNFNSTSVSCQDLPSNTNQFVALICWTLSGFEEDNNLKNKTKERLQSCSDCSWTSIWGPLVYLWPCPFYSPSFSRLSCVSAARIMHETRKVWPHERQ